MHGCAAHFPLARDACRPAEGPTLLLTLPPVGGRITPDGPAELDDTLREPDIYWGPYLLLPYRTTMVYNRDKVVEVWKLINEVEAQNPFPLPGTVPVNFKLTFRCGDRDVRVVYTNVSGTNVEGDLGYQPKDWRWLTRAVELAGTHF